MGKIRVGTSGYSFQSWKGTAYPSNIKASEMFSYYVDQFRFNTVEINYTYYRLPVARTLETLVKKSPKDFDFTVKLYGGITHEPWQHSPPTQVDKEMCRQFLEGIKPLAESGKLGGLLAQFPSSFRSSTETWNYLLSLPELLGVNPMVYEFRNKEWMSEETVKTLERIGIGFCVVDEPQVGSLMPLFPVVTSNVAYLRLHGRNRDWFNDPSHRYDYLYSEEELKGLLPIIDSLASQENVLYIQFNNCHAGSAVQNGKMLRALLGIDLPPVQGKLL